MQHLLETVLPGFQVTPFLPVNFRILSRCPRASVVVLAMRLLRLEEAATVQQSGRRVVKTW
jgi:hypothetical protein